MTMKVGICIASATLVAMAGLVSMSGASYAEGEKDLAETVKKIGDMVKAGKGTDAAKASTALAKKIEETADMMHLYRPRNKGGMGWGPKAGTNPINDGLEKKIEELIKGVPPTFFKDPNNEAAINWMAALMEITLAKVPEKDMAGGKTKKAWIGYSEDLRKANAAFSKAVAAKDGKAVSTAATSIKNACVSCHSKFKE